MVVKIFWGIAFLIILADLFFYKQARQKTLTDYIVDSAGILILYFLVPFFYTLIDSGVRMVIPPQVKVAAPVAAQLLLFVGGEYIDYWYHRLSHASSILYKLHVPHHEAIPVDALASFRTNLLYVFLLPGNLFFALVFQFVETSFLFLILFSAKIIWTFATHSIVLRKINWPFENTLRKIFIMPVDHFVHHTGTGYNTNFSFLFTFIDVMHGTYKRGDKKDELNLTSVRKAGVMRDLFYPFWPSKEQ